MWGKGKYPMLYLLGGQDSGKSTMTMLLRNLIDPVSTPMTGKPPSIDDLYLKASKHAVLAFNNLSAMSNDFSDAFCTLTFEGGYERRTKHTDGDLTAYSNRVPIIMNGIELATYRPDFLDRCFIVRLPENDDLKHGYDEELQARFREAQPYFLGALFNGLAAALRDYKKTRLERVPRIADEARVITAAEPAIGMASGTFVNLLLDRRQEERELQVELSPLASLLHDHILRDKTEWIGTRKQLLLIAKAQAKNYGDLPRTSQKVTSELERLAPVLKSVNIKVDMHHGRESWGRLMRIYRIPPPEAKQKRERLKLKPKVGHKKPARSAKS
jgi:hypothetical protein